MRNDRCTAHVCQAGRHRSAKGPNHRRSRHLPAHDRRSQAKTPHDRFYYYWNYGLEAVRSGPWKLHLPHEYRTLAGEPGKDGQPGPYKTEKIDQVLYNLTTDVGEKTNVADKNPEVVQKLLAIAEEARADLGDSLTNRPGTNRRPAGQLKQ